MCKKLTKKQKAALAKYEQNLRTATQSNFTRAMSQTAVQEVKQVYEQLTGQPYRMNKNCSACVLDLLKRTARLYFNDKPKIKAK